MDLLVSVTTRSFGIMSENRFDVYDRETNNVIAHISPFEDLDDRVFCFTFSNHLIKKIKNYLKEPSLALKQEDDGYANDCVLIVRYGFQTDVDLYLESGMKHFSYYLKLDDYKEYLDNYPQTKAVCDIVSCIDRNSRRQIRKILKEERDRQ